MAKPIRLIVEPKGDQEVTGYRFAIPEVSGATVEITYEQALILADRILGGADFDSVDPQRRRARPRHADVPLELANK